jgi:hypothetical protein
VLDADEHGRFAGEITAGTYAVTAEVRVDGRAKPQPVVCRAGLELSPGQRVVRKLEFVAR